MLSKIKTNDPTDTNYVEDNSSSVKYMITDHMYGKNNVKILQLVRNGPIHSIKEFMVSTKLQLMSQKDYTHGDNSDIIATDSQKNTVYVLARKHGIKSAEQFGIILCDHFLKKYGHVKRSKIWIEESPWERLGYGTGPYSQLHNHAFVYTPVSTKTCEVTWTRGDKTPEVITGLNNLRVLKTTKSSFVNFVNDEFRTLPDQTDRFFSTIVRAQWSYNVVDGIDFDKVFNIVKQIILTLFAGEPVNGIDSPSVQHTLYLSNKEVLDTFPQVEWIEMEMPNKHYFNIDFTKFEKALGEADPSIDVLQPVSDPAGNIYCKLNRKDIMSKL